MVSEWMILDEKLCLHREEHVIFDFLAHMAVEISTTVFS